MTFILAVLFTITGLMWGYLAIKYMDDPKSVHEDMIKSALLLLTVVYIGMGITVAL